MNTLMKMLWQITTFLIGIIRSVAAEGMDSNEFMAKFLPAEPDRLCQENANEWKPSALIEVRDCERKILDLIRLESGHYYLRAQRVDISKAADEGTLWSHRAPRQYKERIINEDLAKDLIYLWLHELHRIPGDGKKWLGCCGYTLFFSAQLPEGGWACGSSWSPQREAPPLWMAKAVDSLVNYVFEPSDLSPLNSYRKYQERILDYEKEGNSKNPQQEGADQPATAPQLKSEGKKNINPESEVRPR